MFPWWQRFPVCCHRGRGSRVEEWTGQEGGSGRWRFGELLCIPLALPSYGGDRLWGESKGVRRLPVPQCQGAHQVGLGREHLQPFPGPCRDGLPVVRPVRSRGVEISGVQTVVGAIQEGLILEEEPWCVCKTRQSLATYWRKRMQSWSGNLISISPLNM